VICAVVTVEAVFVGGVALRIVGATGISAVARVGVLALVGGLLVVPGADEVWATHRPAGAPRPNT
jgi:hypothetical protein